MPTENYVINCNIESLAIIKAAFDCAQKGSGLYGNIFTPEERVEAVRFYGEAFETRLDALEALCAKEGYEFNHALLRLDIQVQETLRRARNPDPTDLENGPKFL